MRGVTLCISVPSVKKSHRVKVTSPRPLTVPTVSGLSESERNISGNINQTVEAKSQAETVPVNISQTVITERNLDRQLIILPGREY